MIKILFVMFLIFNSSFAQSKWFEQDSFTNSRLNGVFFLNTYKGWCIGDSGLILKTSNGGLNWKNYDSVATSNLNAITFTSELIGYIAGENGLILRTSDGGNSWSKSKISSHSFSHLSFVSNFVGYVCAKNSNYIYRTFNGGDSWDSVDTGFGLDCVFFVSPNTGWISARLLSGNAIYKTTNFGLNWMRQYFTGGNDMIYSLFFIDSTNGWCGSPYSTLASNPTIFKTTNGGDNWFDPYRYTFFPSLSIYFVDLNHGWAGGYSGSIHYTSNSGNNWVRQTPEIGTRIYRSIYFVDLLTGWCVGDSGRILKTTTGGLTYAMNSISEIPNNYYVSQNYPNPFNPSTRIVYKCILRGHVLLKIFDMLGNDVAILVNEDKLPGAYEVVFDGSSFPSGLYFYELQVDGTVIDTKRMILLK